MVQSLARIRYNPESDTLVVRVDEFSSVANYVAITEDIEIGVNEAGAIVEIRVASASRRGLSKIFEILRRRRRRASF